MGNMLANKKIRTLLICLAFIPLIFGMVLAVGAYASKARTTKNDSPATMWVKNEFAAEFPNFGPKLKPVSPPKNQKKSEITQVSAAPKITEKQSEGSSQQPKPVQQAAAAPASGSTPVKQPAANPAQTPKPASQPASKQAKAAKPASPQASVVSNKTAPPASQLPSNQEQTSNQEDGSKPDHPPAANPDSTNQPQQQETSKQPASTPAVPAQNKPSVKPPAPTASGKQRELYLTFDDGPHRVSNQILDLLDKYNAKATFFMLDGNMKQYPNAVKRMAASGHSLGMHGVSHNKQKFYHSAQTVVAEMDQGRDTIKRLAGIDTVLIRTPFGSSPYMKPDYKKAVTAHGYKMWDWNVDSRDWFYRDRRFVDSAIEQIEKQKSKPGPIVVLLHERDETLACLPALLEYLKSQNFKLLPLTSSMAPVQFK
ncbi:hypothetical protein DRW41_09695 [Neobacillus piezotolerans]|uniref:NodB homology domain-containing protein n=1 Tax=Neobacillus piezotolerans TaxID=2259171 RepID=A0A3D8GRP1_9BACI|nr:polysaccharide deacetylase family protein [Neobacillus piezotolerans]RDU36962.1 hypothetical protein DRW41_09695 [Neobacillus piezotolerans]